jgi:hypothetical protein
MKAEAVNLAGKRSPFDKRWFPRVVVSFNGHDIMVVNVTGRFVWRSHTETDDFFLVLRGRLRIELRDGTVSLGPRELYVAPRGIEQAVHLGLRALLQLPSRHRAQQNSGGLQSGRAEVRTGRRTPPMTQAYRVEGGASLDRARPPLLRVRRRRLRRYEGDTPASALLASGVRLVGSSYKHHSPRGILSAEPEEPNALVGVSRAGRPPYPEPERNAGRAHRWPRRDEPEPLAVARVRRRRDKRRLLAALLAVSLFHLQATASDFPEPKSQVSSSPPPILPTAFPAEEDAGPRRSL